MINLRTGPGKQKTIRKTGLSSLLIYGKRWTNWCQNLINRYGHSVYHSPYTLMNLVEQRQQPVPVQVFRMQSSYTFAPAIEMIIPGHEEIAKRLTAQRERIELASYETPVLRKVTNLQEQQLVPDNAGSKVSVKKTQNTESSPPSQPELPAKSINQLTDQIIHAIDQRIIAQRERMGRI